ncbi:MULTISPECIES: adenosylcobalamin-dependent ribonucleoside-diphosphate reductase [unclassified Thiomonas]|uniref:adenosylcobalamin-dependent ribonucleoside-diphosphate reductase n=1 Tax=unclassified Thiomonas TaxID=2625466 RepID=UPI0004DBC504|nr:MULTISPECIES: adenosylcobalamin-dependent ribonucleoside-diphosphate reductase [unclassified Thiomonas]CDW92428.1 Ribonucleoside-diphosphate reductase [Thiomonas sp. CB2]VDY05883.1 Ribonucleoside-diphosphate reductase [Thiomonas sp. Bio17B3]VDY10820.1 Ribonucleoside-diphosphate reductase [Thiomonas sp. Sup16B3]VDY14146.1 Putative Ribonucleoside-diphosphate reductase large chain [Thiomonas sp. OC7]VDY16659.1 Ribonucleoside-diphosphate reductase [Thiomonas sp. CB2]
MQAQDISLDVLAEKYAKGDERTIADIHTRVARALAVEEADPARSEALFRQALADGFVPAGRIMSAAGTDIQATLINCFVQPVGDSVSDDKDGKPSIYKALAQAAETMRRGGGVGYDFSRIRPAGAHVGGTHSRASGPLSFMRVFDASCETVESAGSRRGAQMGVLRADHPDIEAFIHAKDQGAFKNFNLSVGVSAAFMQAVENDAQIDLVHKARPGDDQLAAGAHQRADGEWVYRSVRARDLWDQIMQSTYDHAEPGILFLDTANADNNLYYCETFEATNPCAEEFLPDYGCCCLGSINLTRFVRDPFTPQARFDAEGFQAVTRVAVRMLDNVLDVTYWPLVEQHNEAQNKRRIGLGFLGLGDACVMLGLRYDSDDARRFAADMARTLRDAAYAASVDLAKEKGAFPLFDAKKYLDSGFAKRLPEALRADIAAHGIRNSHLLAVAPTGTISLAFADNASNGIEPAFSWVYTRKKRMADNTTREYEVADHAWRLYRSLGHDMSALPPAFVTALEMSATDHMKMLQVVQPFIDTSISKTVNVPADYPYDDFKDLYLQAWKAGLKGLATYRPNAVLGAVLQATPTAAAPAAASARTADDIDPLTRRIEGRPSGDLQAVTSKISYMTSEGQKTVYLSVSFAEVEGRVNGEAVRIERPIEFFMPAGQRDEGQQWIASNMRLLSLVARSGGSIAKSLQNMREVVWDKGPVRCGEVIKSDGSRAPRFHQSEVAAIAYALQELLRRRGYLDASGREQSLLSLAQRAHVPEALRIDLESADASPELLPGGRICPECGGPFLRRVDGCDRCENCGYIGSCG